MIGWLADQRNSSESKEPTTTKATKYRIVSSCLSPKQLSFSVGFFLDTSHHDQSVHQGENNAHLLSTTESIIILAVVCVSFICTVCVAILFRHELLSIHQVTDTSLETLLLLHCHSVLDSPGMVSSSTRTNTAGENKTSASVQQSPQTLWP